MTQIAEERRRPYTQFIHECEIDNVLEQLEPLRVLADIFTNLRLGSGPEVDYGEVECALASGIQAVDANIRQVVSESYHRRELAEKHEQEDAASGTLN